MAQIPDGKLEADKKLVQAKRQFEKLMFDFHKFLEDQILPENKTQVQLKTETDFVLRLLMSANDLDILNPGEGTFGMITLLIREGFLMRDNNNKLNYKHKQLQSEINKLKQQIMDMSSAGQRNG